MAPSRKSEISDERLTAEEKRRLGELKLFLEANNIHKKFVDAEVVSILRKKGSHEEAALALLEEAQKRDEWHEKSKESKKKEEKGRGRGRQFNGGERNVIREGGRGRGVRGGERGEKPERADRGERRTARPQNEKPIKTAPKFTESAAPTQATAKTSRDNRGPTHTPATTTGGLNYAAVAKKSILRDVPVVATTTSKSATDQVASMLEPERTEQPHTEDRTNDLVESTATVVHEDLHLEASKAVDEIVEETEEVVVKEVYEATQGSKDDEDMGNASAVRAAVTMPKALDDGLMGITFNFGNFDIKSPANEVEPQAESSNVEDAQHAETENRSVRDEHVEEAPLEESSAVAKEKEANVANEQKVSEYEGLKEKGQSEEPTVAATNAAHVSMGLNAPQQTAPSHFSQQSYGMPSMGGYHGMPLSFGGVGPQVTQAGLQSGEDVPAGSTLAGAGMPQYGMFGDQRARMYAPMSSAVDASGKSGPRGVPRGQQPMAYPPSSGVAVSQGISGQAIPQQPQQGYMPQQMLQYSGYGAMGYQQFPGMYGNYYPQQYVQPPYFHGNPAAHFATGGKGQQYHSQGQKFYQAMPGGTYSGGEEGYMKPTYGGTHSQNPLSGHQPSPAVFGGVQGHDAGRQGGQGMKLGAQAGSSAPMGAYHDFGSSKASAGNYPGYYGASQQGAVYGGFPHQAYGSRPWQGHGGSN